MLQTRGAKFGGGSFGGKVIITLI